jgi:hypothetical protein
MLRFVKEKIQDIGYSKRKKLTHIGFPPGLFDCSFGKNRDIGTLEAVGKCADAKRDRPKAHGTGIKEKQVPNLM